MVSNAVDESESSQSLSDTSSSRNRSGNMQVEGEATHKVPVSVAEELASNEAHEGTVKHKQDKQSKNNDKSNSSNSNDSNHNNNNNNSNKKRLRLDDVSTSSPLPSKQASNLPEFQAPKEQRQADGRGVPSRENPAAQRPPPAPLFHSRMLDKELPGNRSQQRQVIRPTSVPHEKSVFSLGLEALQLHKPAEGEGSPKFNRVGEGVDAGRKSFIEWRPLESGATGIRPSAVQLPGWNMSQAAAAAAHHNYFITPPMSSTYNIRQMPMLGNVPLTYSAGLSNSQGWGTQHQLQNIAAGALPGVERLAPSGLLGLSSGAATYTVSVVFDGRSVSGTINLLQHQSYASFARAIRSMFQDPAEASREEEECSLSNAVPGHIIAYEDAEGDLLLAGDLSWRDFVRAAKRIKVMPAKGRRLLPVP